ncbi:aldehyde dehydrogenase family protein [Salipaludibacillus agaradhaerens]|uniref:aldehyde dehydrogenase family protein n=1 Tax=Salipaludibacillus agaradhaerens TaxID=76935 RepID=UPI002150A85C|nr:aldehyde dehydrogenase family protein [Salipaludibacillus agaradhaerens]MCR6107715.1 aldehyde dehydrogenase family protein [Salipaludibacillus agaradhaerens]MCR6119744.1 aldehyde dehydrogenase family protein [Salipaludibacillus agaradhaerens]UJW58805.1 aldehyde dehydrogenase family protein [Bacillus sp. A116_S68]
MQIQVRTEKMLVAGNWLEAGAMFDVINPQNNEVIAKVPKATEKDMMRAIEKSEEAFRHLASWPTHERIKVLQKAADYVANDFDNFAETIALEGSKTINEARSEVTRTIQTLNISAEEVRRLKGETLNFDQREGSENRTGYYYRFPIGIIAAITPFNDPLNLVAHKVGPALAAGNPIIVKPASSTPLSALLLAKALDEAGVPKGFLSVVTGAGSDIGDTLITHPFVKMVSFTGGFEAGEKIAHKAGLKKVAMELGSNSPVIVLKDACLSDAVISTVSGAFSAAGQNCLGVQRIFVEESVYKPFISAFVDRTKELTVGDKMSEWTDIGPLINEKEAKRVETWIEEAVFEGAVIETGGIREGAYIQPTVLTQVSPQSTIYQEEVFGPVVMIEPVRHLKEAIKKANDVNYGLQAGIFTKNMDHAFYAVHHLQSGAVMVNDSSDYRIDEMPFGGVKGSGLGREGVRYAIHDMTDPKVVCFKIDSMWGVS